jgi:threonine/homoserine/homoserine lactone efflux protein
MPLFKVFIWGLLISALGTLPLGTTNIAGMQISMAEGLRQAFIFCSGVVLVEMLYVRVALIGINWIRHQKKLLYWMEWIAFAIVLALAAGSFIAALNPSQQKNIILQNNLHRFVLGATMCAVNPVQIPFWFGWSTVLFTKGVLQPKNSFYNLYILGIGLGTVIGNCVFIFGGKYIVEKLGASQNLMNYILGGVFLVTALIQLIKILKNKGTNTKLENQQKDEPELLIKKADMF